MEVVQGAIRRFNAENAPRIRGRLWTYFGAKKITRARGLFLLGLNIGQVTAAAGFLGGLVFLPCQGKRALAATNGLFGAFRGGAFCVFCK